MQCHLKAQSKQGGRHRLVIKNLEHGYSLADLTSGNAVSEGCTYRLLPRHRTGGIATSADRRSNHCTQQMTLEPQQPQQAERFIQSL